MSESSKKVEWCLAKANKEIEEGKKKGQGNVKHRGLLKNSPNKEEVINYIKSRRKSYLLPYRL